MLDFSIMPSLECDLNCSFCMYDAGPNNKEELDYDKASKFIKSIDWGRINQVGFYGGEPAINQPLYQKYIDLIPHDISKFIISNGTWSTSHRNTNQFIHFLSINNLYLIVSGTPEHKIHQDREYLKFMAYEFRNAMRLKGDDVIHKMGRGKTYHGAISECSGFCKSDDRVTRLAIMPNGNIVYQNCHGNYPVVQTIDEPFAGIGRRIKRAVLKCMENINVDQKQ